MLIDELPIVGMLRFTKIPQELENLLMPYSFCITNVFVNNNHILGFDSSQIFVDNWINILVQGKKLTCNATIEIYGKTYRVFGMFPYRTIYNSDNFFNNEFCFDYIELVDENKEYRYTESIENEIKQKSIENEDIKLLKKDLRKKIKIKHETQDDDIENIMKELDEELTNPEKSWEKRLNSKTEELWKHQD